MEGRVASIPRQRGSVHDRYAGRDRLPVVDRSYGRRPPALSVSAFAHEINREARRRNEGRVVIVGQTNAGDVKTYIAHQEEHHRKITYQDELRLLLTRHEIEFDERYVWD